MAELGKAYISVIPSMKGGAGQLRSELSGTMSKASGPSGMAFAAGFGKAAVKAMGAIGLATSVGGVLTKGWDRMTAIDDAKAKLTALGHSVEEVSAISDNANAAVKGTAYGMDAAMSAAASATAAGIEPGKELTRYLSLMGDAAAVAGVDMNEMGSIFNKVAANGKVTTEEMNQLADRGIPIWQLLAKETGMSMDELRTAISNGEVDITAFQNAIETGMGGAAKTIGSTTIHGAISNIGASLSRMGANFLGSADDANSFAGKLMPLFNNLMGFMGKIEAGASVLGQIIGAVLGPIMDALGQVFTELGKGTGEMGPLKDLLLQVGTAIGQIVAALVPVLIPAIRIAISYFSGLMDVLKKMSPAVTPVISAFKGMAKIIGAVVSGILKTINLFIKFITGKMSFKDLARNVRIVWNKVKLSITKPINDAKTKVKGIIDKIKGLFPLSIGKIFSNLKIPHISISGGKAPFGIGGLGKKPSISVSWHDKAMENPYLFSNATLFGAGETGDEVLYGRRALMRDIAEAKGNNGNTYNVTLNATSDESPEQYAQRFARELRRQVRMGAI